MIETGINIEKLPEDPAELKRIIKAYQIKMDNYQTRLEEERRKYIILEEKFLLLQRRFFSSKSEKLTKEENEQSYLFNEAEIGSIDEKVSNEDKIIIKEHTRKKSGKRAIPDNIPREEIIHDLSEEEKKCICCGKDRPKIGKEETEELDIIPAKIIVKRHIRIKYGACKCEGSKDSNLPEVITAVLSHNIYP